MGITGLLPLLKPACRPVNLSQFKGCTVAIDSYCWLHKGAFGCAEQLVQGKKTDGYVRYVMKYINLLLKNNIKPILVFDGRNLPSKSETEKKRRTARKENREKAVQMMKEGRMREATEFFQRSVDITPAMAREVIHACRDRNIDCIVAPYEADSQLAYLNMAGLADIILTEDSDLTLFGCDKVIFKLQDTGDGVLYERNNLSKVFGLNADSFNFEKFRYMCILAGCDYLANLPGIGLGKAKKFWLLVTNPDLKNVLRKIPAYLKMPQTIVTEEYIERFIRANNTFLYQLVFDPVTKKERPLTPYPSSLQDSPSKMTYCGTYSPPTTALQLALGNLDIHSLVQVTSFCPDNPPCPPDKPRYGAKAGHRSMWCSGYQDMVGSGGGGEGVNKKKMIVFEIGENSSNSGRSEINRIGKSVVNEEVRNTGEKRKSIVVTEDKIADLLSEKTENSPPLKRIKLGTEKNIKLSKLVGATENFARPGVVTVSKYFACDTVRDDAIIANAITQTDNDNKEVSLELKAVSTSAGRGRRLSIGDSGAWFKDIEQPSSVQGKFIYRAEPEAKNIRAGEALKDISNSPEAVDDDLERKKKRNPFAVKLKTKEFTSLPPSPPSPTPCETLPNSQLSMFSIDGASLTFSSQDLPDSQEISAPVKSISSPQSEVNHPLPSKHISSPPSSGPPRLGLSKFSFKGCKTGPGPSSTIKSAVPKNNFVPVKARVSGLSRAGSSGGLKQPSLLQMFARKCPKAKLGGGTD